MERYSRHSKRNMSLQNFEALGFRIHSVMFGYLYPLPVKWNKNYTEVSENLPRRKWIPYFIVSFYIVLLGLISFYTVFQYKFGTGHPQFEIFNAISLTIAGSITIYFAIFVGVTLINRQSAVQFVNFVIFIAAKISNGINIFT